MEDDVREPATIEVRDRKVVLLDLLPAWECHKVVRAGKIVSITLDADAAAVEGRETTGGAALAIESGGTVDVGPDYVHKHGPHVGGYFVMYDDGYESFSPAIPFELGYTRLCRVYLTLLAYCKIYSSKEEI